MCDHYNVRLYETPVGFKYLCRMMTEKDIIIAGEESGGIAVKGHLPERDGIFIGFLLAEVMAVRRKKLSELVKELFDEFGEHHFGRIDAHLTIQQKEKVMKFYQSKPKKFGSFATTKFDLTDGIKVFTNDGWILVRASGTEPLIRFYAESSSPKKVQQMLKAATSVK
jgi:phosphomannomutase